MTTSKQLDTYVVRAGDARVGPVTLDQLRRGLEAGKIPEDAEAQSIAGGDWRPVAEVAARFVLPPPRLPPSPRLPEPSWSDFEMGEVVPPDGAPPLPSSATSDEATSTAATATFGRPHFLVFVPGSLEPPAGPFTTSELKDRMDRGMSPSHAKVCVVDEHACWIPITRLFDEQP